MPHQGVFSVFAPQSPEQLLAVEGENHVTDRGCRMKIVHLKVDASSADGSMADADEGVCDRREIHYLDFVARLLDRMAKPRTKICPRAIQGDQRLS